MAWRLESRAPRTGRERGEPTRDADVIAGHLRDAAQFPGGQADTLLAARSEADVADLLRSTMRVLPIGAQSSLTGGATPTGGALLSTEQLKRVTAVNARAVRLEAGVTLAALDERLAETGAYYPPLPTFTGAFIGGAISTNAAGA